MLEYVSLQSFTERTSSPAKVVQLPFHWQGSGHVVYNGFLYYHKADTTNQIVKVCKWFSKHECDVVHVYFTSRHSCVDLHSVYKRGWLKSFMSLGNSSWIQLQFTSLRLHNRELSHWGLGLVFFPSLLCQLRSVSRENSFVPVELKTFVRILWGGLKNFQYFIPLITNIIHVCEECHICLSCT